MIDERVIGIIAATTTRSAYYRISFQFALLMYSREAVRTSRDDVICPEAFYFRSSYSPRVDVSARHDVCHLRLCIYIYIYTARCGQKFVADVESLILL